MLSDTRWSMRKLRPSPQNGRVQEKTVVGKTCGVVLEKWQRRGSFFQVSIATSRHKVECCEARSVIYVFVLCATNEWLEARLKKTIKTKLRPRRCSLVLCWQRPGGRVHTFSLLAGIPKIPYRPTARPGEVLCFKHYNADEVGGGAFVLSRRVLSRHFPD